MLMIPHITQIEQALDAVSIESASAFRWFGEVSDTDTPDVGASLDDQMREDDLVLRLTKRLYSDFYCAGGPRRGPNAASEPSAQVTGALTERLSNANSGLGQWQSGWRSVRKFADSSVIAARGSFAVRAKPDEYRAIQEAEDAGPDGLLVKVSKESLGMSPGHYLALGNNELLLQPSANLLRFYWNVVPDGAVALTEFLTRRLNDAGCPFQLKVLNVVKPVERCDTAILYIADCDYAAVKPDLEEAYRFVEKWLRPATPAMTKRLGGGAAMAVSPADGESFGWHRCGLLANAMMHAHGEGAIDTADRLCVIASHFGAEGINIERPYLPDCMQDTVAPFKKDVGFDARVERETPSDADRGPVDYQDVALEIGLELSRTAVRAGDRCTWIGHDLAAGVGEGAQDAVVLGTLGTSLYTGTAGVGLALVEVGVACNNDQLIDCARSALRQTSALMNGEADQPSHGLYTGRLGGALALARGGVILECAEMQKAAHIELDRATGDFGECSAFDVLTGHAGHILGLLAIGGLLGRDQCVDQAISLGNKLIGSANRHPHGWSWCAQGDDGHRGDLLGYSHGTSGVAHALFELASKTGLDKYRVAAQQAIAYEQHHFDNRLQVWPDLRLAPACKNNTPGASEPSESHLCAWCHGAAGIALSRLRVHRDLWGPDYGSDVKIARSAILRNIERSEEAGLPDVSYCHGLAGNLEILWELSAVGCEPERASSRPYCDTLVIDRAVALAISKYLPDHNWRGGLSRGRTPGLMLGDAGIAYFFLRLSGCKVPSLLGLRAGDFA